jgi:xanthine dehydrogenase accessory factor
MRSLWPKLASWLASDEPFALATVTAVSGSAPRAPGATMAIMPEASRFLGAVSSGCLDIEVVEAARAALRTRRTQRLRFGPDGKPPWSDGLTCGGWIAVRVDPWWGMHTRAEVRAIVPRLRAWLENDAPGVIVSSDEHHVALDPSHGNERGKILGDARFFDDEILACARDALEKELPPFECERAGRLLFIRTIRRRPRLVLIGGVDVALHLITPAREAGFATIVVDPREAFTRDERYTAMPDQLTRAWPQKIVPGLALGPRDAAIALTHDPKIDDAALLALLETRAGYIGALGSTRSHAARLDRLRTNGARDEHALERIHGPAGIHLGTPDAPGIALGIFAGVLKWQADEERRRSVAVSEISAR